MNKKLSLSMLVISFLFFNAGENIFATDQPEVIREIKITGNRVKESIIRKALTFKEGDVVNEENIEKSKENLFRLGLFKSLEIKQEWVEELHGSRVIITVEDGWFIFPLPMAGGRGGRKSIGLMLIEQNLFKNNERVMLGGVQQGKELLGTGSIFLFPYLLMFGSFRNYLTEYEYKDGGFNSQQFMNASDSKKFGQINNYYEKELYQSNLTIGLPFPTKMRSQVSFITNTVRYSDALTTLPTGGGKINSLRLEVNWGEGNTRDEGDMIGGIGRIFGLGMAEIEDSLKNTYKPAVFRQYHISVERGDKIFGSNFTFSKIAAVISRGMTFKKRNSIALSLGGSLGFNLPFSELFATNQQEGLRGFYVREYRGDKIFMTNVTYSHPFFRSRKGFLNSEIFAEYALCGRNDVYGKKEGIGFDFSYNFWRFPLPLTLGYTYSFDDHNWQTIFSIGGRF